MHAEALTQSLTAIDLMLHDLLDEHGQSVDLTDGLRDLVETAQRNISTAQHLRRQKAVNDAIQKQPIDVTQVSAQLSTPERWLVRHVGQRAGFDATLLGSCTKRLTDLGLIEVSEGKATLTEMGVELNSFWARKR